MYKVLVADDEIIERKVLCKLIRKQFGDVCEVFEAKSGREAIAMFQQEQIQIAILDIEMPGYNGLEAAKVMREQNEHCVILFLTAFSEFSYAKQAIAVKAMDYILKPYEEKEILFAVEEAMRLAIANPQAKISQDTGVEIDELPEDGEELRMSKVKEIIETYIKNHYAEDVSMYDMAKRLNYSEGYFCKLFKQCFRVNFTSYLSEFRMEKAKELLQDPLMNIKDIGRMCGYGDSNYFARVFKRSTGFTPSEYRIYAMKNKKN